MPLLLGNRGKFSLVYWQWVLDARTRSLEKAKLQPSDQSGVMSASKAIFHTQLSLSCSYLGCAGGLERRIFQPCLSSVEIPSWHVQESRVWLQIYSGSLGGEIPPPVADTIKQGYEGNVKHGLEREISMEGLLLVLTALFAFIFAQNWCIRHLNVTVTEKLQLIFCYISHFVFLTLKCFLLYDVKNLIKSPYIRLNWAIELDWHFLNWEIN